MSFRATRSNRSQIASLPRPFSLRKPLTFSQLINDTGTLHQSTQQLELVGALKEEPWLLTTMLICRPGCSSVNENHLCRSILQATVRNSQLPLHWWWWCICVSGVGPAMNSWQYMASGGWLTRKTAFYEALAVCSHETG